MKRPTVVILGGGFGGAYCALELQKRLGVKEVDIVLINRTNYLLFYPLLIEAGIGEIEMHHAVVGLREFLPKVNFILGDVQNVDLQKQLVTYRAGLEGPVQTAPYDHLVIALGAVNRKPHIPGLKEFSFSISSLPDAIRIRDHMIEMVETANSITDPEKRKAFLRFLIVGGNFTGVEMAGEINSFLKHSLSNYSMFKKDEIQVSLVNRAPTILKELPEELSQYAIEKMRQDGIEFIFNNTVTEIKEDHAVLRDGTVYPTRTVLWCAGIQPPELIQKSNLPKDDHGYILAEPTMQIKGFQNVWGVGDCTKNIDSDGNPYPTTAQFATKEGKECGRLIAAKIRGQEISPRKIKSEGSLAKIGYHAGVGMIGNLKFSGRLGWFLFRTVYIIKVPGFRRSIRAGIEWFMDLVFGRDVYQVGLKRNDAASDR